MTYRFYWFSKILFFSWQQKFSKSVKIWWR